MAQYYVDTAADAGGDGTTTALTGASCAFKTVAQVVAATFVPGDVINFRRGRTWREQLIIGESGTLDLPITYQDYGTGALPAICGADLVTNWTNHSGNIWQATLASEPAVVLFDGTVGTKVANHDACAAAGDWVWESSVLYTYSASDPDTAYVDPGIEAGTSRWVISTNYQVRNYITLRNLRLYGFSGSPAIHAQYPVGWTVEAVTIEKGARTGIQMIAPTDLTIYDSTLTGIRTLTTVEGWKGIYCYGYDSTHPGGNISIHGCDINYWTGYGVHILGYSSTYRSHNNYVYDCDLSHNTAGCYMSYCDTGELYDLTCDDNLRGPNQTGGEQYGCAFQTVSNFNMYRVTATNGRVGMEIWGWDGSGAFPLSGPSENNHLWECKFNGHSENGFIIATGCCNYTLLERIEAHGNQYGGMNISESQGASIGCRLYHATLYNNNKSNGGYGNLHFGSGCAGWTVKNVVSFAVTGYAFRCTAAGGFLGTHAHNDWWKASGNLVDNNGTYYTTATIAAWEPDGGLSVDPKFKSVTAGSEDLDIPTDSPLVNVAENVGSNYDILHRPIV